MTHSTPSPSPSTPIPSSKHFGSTKKTRKGSFGQTSPSKIAEVGEFQGGYFIMPTPPPPTTLPSSSSYPSSKPLRSSPDKRNKRYEPAQRDGVLPAKDTTTYESTASLSTSPTKIESSPSKKNSRKTISATKTTAAVSTPSKEIPAHDRWAGAAFSNAPPPSSLPLPSFPPLSSAPSSPPHPVSHSHPSNVPSHSIYLDVQPVHYTDPATGYPVAHGGHNTPYHSSSMSMDHPYALHYAHHPSHLTVSHVHHHPHHHVPPMMSSSFPPPPSLLPPLSSSPSTLPLAMSLAELSLDLRRILNISEEVHHHPRLVPVHSS